MPLPKPVKRECLHTRSIQCYGYQRDDGLWEVEAHMTDIKSYDFPNQFRGQIKAGEPLHDMWLRVTFDSQMCIVEVEAKTDAAPFGVCAEINRAFRKLEGLIIAPGWKRQTRTLLGGVKGCTHLLELLGPVATVAFQTFYGARSKAIREDRVAVPENNQSVFLLNSCHAYAENSEVVKLLYPAFYKKRQC